MCIIDGDDWLETDFVAYMLKLVKETKSDMGFSDNIFTTRDRKQIEDDCIEKWTPEDATAAIIYPHMAIGPWNKIYSMQLIKKNNIFFSVPWLGEGLYFASRAAQFAKSVGVGHRKVYNYRLNNADSGMTNYNVQMGINALQNITYIRDTLILDSEKVNKAVKWHIWKNNYLLLMLIVATNSKKQFSKEYKVARKYILLTLPKVLIESEVSLNWKIKMCIQAVFPKTWAKLSVMKAKKGLLADNMD